MRVRDGPVGAATESPQAQRSAVALKTISQFVGVFIALAALVILCGWIFNVPYLRTPIPGVIPMKANAAAGFIFTGLALWLLRIETPLTHVQKSQRYLAYLFALLAAVIGLLTLCEYIFNWNPGLDQALARELSVPVGTSHPGRMALYAALNFFVAGLSLLLLDVKSRSGQHPSSYLMLIVGISSLMVITGYIYGVPEFRGIPPYTPLALDAAVAFMLVFIGVLLARPALGLSRLLFGDYPGSLVIRLLVPGLILIVLFTGWMRWQGELRGYYSTAFGLAMFSLINIVIAMALLFAVAVRLSSVERRRRRANAKILELNTSLERQVVERTADLRKSEEKYRSIFENAVEGIFQTSPEGRYLSVNPALAKMVGYSSPEDMVDSVSDIQKEMYVHAEDRDRLLESLASGDAVSNFEAEARRRDGSVIWISMSVRTIRDAGGNLAYLEGTVTDVTDRKAAEETLRKREIDYRLLAAYSNQLRDISISLTGASDMQDLFNRIADSLRLLTGGAAATFCTYDKETRLLRVVSLSIDPASREKVDAILGPGLFDIQMPVSPDLREQMLTQVISRTKDLNELSHGVIPQEISDSIMQAVGIDRIISLAISHDANIFGTCMVYLPVGIPVVPDEALKTYAYVAGQAIKRKQSQEALKASEARLRSFYESGLIGVIYWDMNGQITDANDKFLEMVGYTRDDLANSLVNWEKMTPPEYRQLDKEKIAELKTMGVSKKPAEKEYIRKDGTRIPVVMAAATLDEERSNGLAFVLDITERKLAEKALKESEELYRSLFENMLNGFAYCQMVFKDGKPDDLIYIAVNSAFEKLTGLKNVTGRKISEVIPGIRKSSPDIFEIYSRVALTGTPEVFETYVEALHMWFYVSVYSSKKGFFVAVFDVITDRKLAEEKLRLSEARYRELFDSMGSSVAVYEAANSGEDFIFRDFSRSAELLDKMHKEDLLGRSVREVFPGVVEFGLFDVFKRVWRTGVPEHHPVSQYKDSKITAWRENYVYKLPSGEVVAIYDDVTERRKAEEDLLNSAIFLNNMVEQSPVATWISDEKGTLIKINKACCELLKITEEEVVGKYNVLKDNIVQAQGYMPLVRNVFEKGEVAKFQLYYDSSRLKDLPLNETVTLILDATIFPIRDAGGKITNAAIQEVDLTARKRAEEKLHESELMYRLLADHMVDIVWLMDMNLRITYISPSAEKVRGYTLSELQELPIEKQLTPASFQVAAEAYLQEVVKFRADPAYSTVLSLELEFYRKDGTSFWTENTFNLVRNDQGKPISILAEGRDTTDRKKAEEKVKEKTLELESSNAELERFAYVASHDLQEPLRTISSYLQLLERRYHEKLDDKATRYIDFTVEAANRLQSMISGLLEYSRVETRGQPFEVVNTETVLRQTIDNLHSAIVESKGEITHDPLPAVTGDRGQLTRVFQNLLSNSIRYRSQEPLHVHVACEKKDGNWVFSVKDNGIGIDPEYKEQIFTIFQRLHGRDVPGIGLGLSVAKRIVERHGGHIWVESVAGKGATFYFTVPAQGGKHK